MYEMDQEGQVASTMRVKREKLPHGILLTNFLFFSF